MSQPDLTSLLSRDLVSLGIPSVEHREDLLSGISALLGPVLQLQGRGTGVSSPTLLAWTPVGPPAPSPTQDPCWLCSTCAEGEPRELAWAAVFPTSLPVPSLPPV